MHGQEASEGNLPGRVAEGEGGEAPRSQPGEATAGTREDGRGSGAGSDHAIKSPTLSKSEAFSGEGLLAEIADRATAEGYHFLTVRGKVFRIEEGRSKGSSLGLSRVRVDLV